MKESIFLPFHVQSYKIILKFATELSIKQY